MNTTNNKIATAVFALLLALPFWSLAQDSTKTDLVLNVSYYMNNNKVVYLMANTKTKIKGKFKPVKDVNISLYLDNDSASNLVGKVTTNEEGLAKAILPPALKAAWDGAAKHTFMAVSEASKDFESASAEASITKSRITIDTSSDGEARSIAVKAETFDGTKWIPAPDVEMKIGIRRNAGSILSAGDEATYTTDSTGTATVELKKDQIPGDEKGNIVLAAKVEDNDQLGNLIVDKTVPWGVSEKVDNSFFKQRTLWSTRFRTPIWLLFMAYSIVFGVWGTIIYLIMQLIKIKKIGVSATS